MPPTYTAQQERHRALLLNLARRIRTLRERMTLTQEAFASRCGISVSFASLLERGERSPSYETLIQVAEALEVPLAELFREAQGDPVQDPYFLRLLDFARTRRLSRAQVDRLLAVAEVMFDGEDGDGLGDGKAGASTCSQPRCDRPVLAKGLCTSHYHRARRARQETGTASDAESD